MSKTQILLIILAFVALTFGSFIWMIVTWDSNKEESITRLQNAVPLAITRVAL